MQPGSPYKKDPIASLYVLDHGSYGGSQDYRTKSPTLKAPPNEALLESQVAQNKRPVHPNAAHNRLKVTHDQELLASLILALSPKEPRRSGNLREW